MLAIVCHNSDSRKRLTNLSLIRPCYFHLRSRTSDITEHETKAAILMTHYS